MFRARCSRLAAEQGKLIGRHAPRAASVAVCLFLVPTWTQAADDLRPRLVEFVTRVEALNRELADIQKGVMQGPGMFDTMKRRATEWMTEENAIRRDLDHPLNAATSLPPDLLETQDRLLTGINLAYLAMVATYDCHLNEARAEAIAATFEMRYARQALDGHPEPDQAYDTSLIPEGELPAQNCVFRLP